MVSFVFFGFAALLQHEFFFQRGKNGRASTNNASKTIKVTIQNCQEETGIKQPPK
jgi:hypothetical protein